ncbi:hypothetical protein GX48_04533 [Paracoccidioides brasiliensis]|nr:hypothetical protein GX48_04533 [Paracoccidioides brasiliensis]
MPSVRLHPPSESRNNKPDVNPLPQLLQTPSGLAILELQGTINLPVSPAAIDPDVLDKDLASGGHSQWPTQYETPIGRLIFPDYNDSMDNDPSDQSWMKRVYLYVGRHQRLTGEVKKLQRPLAAIQRSEEGGDDVQTRSKAKSNVNLRAEETFGAEEGNEEDEDSCDELEIIDIVKYKIIFSSRPEPVTSNVSAGVL